MIRFELVLSMLAAALPATGVAQTAVDPAALDREVAAFTGAGIGQPGGAVLPVDRRLRLRPCASPLAIAWRPPARTTVVVACPDPGGWRLFVPVVAAPQPAPAAELPPAVARGEAVTVAVTGTGFSVTRPGIALEAAPIGGWVRVKPVDAGTKPGEALRAQVRQPGLVTVPLP